MPITITFPDDILYSLLMEWLKRLEDKSYVYIFPFREVTFFSEEDAIAFMFAFDGKRRITKVEQMIKYTI